MRNLQMNSPALSGGAEYTRLVLTKATATYIGIIGYFFSHTNHVVVDTVFVNRGRTRPSSHACD